MEKQELLSQWALILGDLMDQVRVHFWLTRFLCGSYTETPRR